MLGQDYKTSSVCVHIYFMIFKKQLITCLLFFILCVLQKKEWLCLNCQTQRLLSGGALDEPPLPVPHPSPKHQPLGSLRHQTPTSQQSPLHKSTTQQGPKPVQPQGQKSQMGTGVDGPTGPTPAKQPTDAKTTTPATAPVPTTEAQKPTKPTEEKPKTEPENQTAKETKPSQKKGEQITPVKEIKKSRHYDVSLAFLFFFSFVYRKV